MFSHQTLGSNDIARSKLFYDALFAAMGGPEGVIDPKGRLIYVHNGGRLLITRPVNGEPACHGNGTTLGLTMDSPDMAEAWHEAGVANGGTTCEDPPGIREMPDGRKLYLAYLRDPDGNKLCALHRIP
ncbi:MAG: VOC family protein [Sphingobium sp.]|nr:VOC family protein [Sphingobium sp.]